MLPRACVMVRTAAPTRGPNWIETGCCAARPPALTSAATSPYRARLRLLACIRILQRRKRSDARRHWVAPLAGHPRAKACPEEAHRIVGLCAAGGGGGGAAPPPPAPPPPG